MKRDFLLVITTFIFMSVSVFTSVYAMEEKDRSVTISKKEFDITGDGIKDTIFLKGVPYDEKEHYLKDIYIEVQSSHDHTKKIPLESGEKASLQVIDLNNDGIKDLFVNVFTGGTDGSTLNHLYTLKDSVHRELTVPEPLTIDSGFENGYKAKLTVTDTGKTYIFDLKDKKKYYKKLGLYYKGKLNEPTELTVHSFQSLKPVLLSEGRVNLKGTQKITGIANGDTIAYVDSSWQYEKGEWSLQKTLVRSYKKKK